MLFDFIYTSVVDYVASVAKIGTSGKSTCAGNEGESSLKGLNVYSCIGARFSSLRCTYGNVQIDDNEKELAS